MRFDLNTYKKLADCIRVLAIDAIEAAGNGHPGTVLGMADVATVLFAEQLRFDPHNPKNLQRDRFVLSNGHGSMLLYALLYLTGYPDMNTEMFAQFRQLGCPLAGHPEYGSLSGVECTTGPLGQGIGMVVGMAIASKKASVGSKVWCVVGDGCLMEGISHEACSLAGHLQLDNLVILHDDNEVTIDGPKSLSDSEITRARFEAYGFVTMEVDGHNFAEISNVLALAQLSQKPVFIACKTVIGLGAPTKAGTCASHGAALGANEAVLAKNSYSVQMDRFCVPQDLLLLWRSMHNLHVSKLDAPMEDLASTFVLDQRSAVPERESTRKSSAVLINSLLRSCDSLIGGSCDLSESNYPGFDALAIAKDNWSGNYIHYGVREHAMAAIMNGIALHGRYRAYGGTFLVFSDYMRPAIRIAALSHLPVVYVMTHDSIGLGEDGPTHQPIEHLASLRAMPNLNVMRPMDAVEVRECWEIALSSTSTPTVLCLTRQDVRQLRHESLENLSQFGAYALTSNDIDPDVTIFASGSEVAIALDVAASLTGLCVRVISVVSMYLFEQQSQEYQASLLNNDSLKVAIEAAARFGWDRYIGRNGLFFGMNGFGASGKGGDLYKYFGIDADLIVASIREQMSMK